VLEQAASALSAISVVFALLFAFALQAIKSIVNSPRARNATKAATPEPGVVMARGVLKAFFSSSPGETARAYRRMTFAGDTQQLKRVSQPSHPSHCSASFSVVLRLSK